MPESSVKRQALGIEDRSSFGLEEEVVPKPPPPQEPDIRYFLLSVTGSDFLAYGEMVLK